jgi:hypothetical protein
VTRAAWYRAEGEPFREWEAHGLTFRAFTVADTDHAAPWEEEDGHGPIREASRHGYSGRIAKRPEERPFSGDHWHAPTYLYDWQAAMKLARAEWGISDDARAALARKLGREPTCGEIAEEAVRQDFQRMRGWVRDDWHYVGVVVVLVDAEGEDVDEETESLWGIESDAGEYLTETADDLAAEIARRVGRRKFVTHGATRTRVRA